MLYLSQPVEECISAAENRSSSQLSESCLNELDVISTLLEDIIPCLKHSVSKQEALYVEHCSLENEANVANIESEVTPSQTKKPSKHSI
jgi:hypothetical protein